MDLLLVARSEGELARLARELQTADSRPQTADRKVAIAAIDLARPDAAKHVAAAARHELGHVDVLVNNAAVVAMLAAATTIFAVSVSAAHSAALRRWSTRVGYVCAVVLAVGSVGVPMLALAIWLIATGITLARSVPTLSSERRRQTPSW
jgi:NAD(P)-dependent dehydrogenase (short-subunit alcohol dehydrogenase family)